MPTYEYQCESCDHKFEKFQAITADPIKECPECGKEEVRKLISGGMGIIFKGSGFYTTDYKNASSQNGNEAPVCPSANQCPKAESCGAKK